MKEKEEFSRLDPDSSHTFRWLALLNWVVPFCLVITGLIITTQKFAPLMNYDPRVFFCNSFSRKFATKFQ